jgi:site-specific DNA-methyltransferase (adenine-specific)
MNNTYKIYHGDCLDVLSELPSFSFQCIFADPPDNINAKYNGYTDKLEPAIYINEFAHWVNMSVMKANIVWFSFNSKYLANVGPIVESIVDWNEDMPEGPVEFKPCVQTFTFGQHRQTDLANCYRPLWRLRWKNSSIYPDNIRVKSWRQENGDKRADPRGRVPGDVFDFPRVTGNSKQRRSWVPTQLHEGLVERCILLSTREGDTVCDPFAGTGTVMRVCKRLNRSCISIDISEFHCQKIAEEHELEVKNIKTPHERDLTL